MRYGIESFFLPEGEGRELEDARNKERVSVDVALSPSGDAAIKALRLDGEIIAEEGLF